MIQSNIGYIKLFRSIRDWRWYDDSNTLSVFIHLLVGASWKDESVWHGEQIAKGELITSVSRLARETGLSDKQIRVCLNRLAEGGEIIKNGANRWTRITICKYDCYQGDNFSEGEQRADKGQTEGEQRATSKEYKNIRIIKKDTKVSKESSRSFVPPTVEEVDAYCKSRNNGINAESFVDFYKANGWVQGRQGKPIKDWKACVRTWERNRFQSGGNAGSAPQGSSIDQYFDFIHQIDNEYGTAESPGGVDEQ